jgi:hypothetical protein
LTKGYVAKVDDEDFRILNALKWQAHEITGRVYAMSGGYYLHRMVLGMQKGDRRLVDHANGDGLDCRKSNLRYATAQQNCHNKTIRCDNSTGFRGVSQRSDYPPDSKRRWQAILVVNGKSYRRTGFSNPEDAARAYDEMARQLHGEFACTNFPIGDERPAFNRG